MTSLREPVAPLPADACLAALLFAVDPIGLGGVTLTAQPGPLRDAWTDFLRERLQPGVDIRRLPISISDDRLLGGLDLPATLRTGRPVTQTGILKEVDGGVLVVSMAERLDLGTGAKLAAAIDQGAVLLEREGMKDRYETRFGVVLFDEHLDEEAPPPAGLTDRLAFAVVLSGRDADMDAGATDAIDAIGAGAVLRAQEILPEVTIDPEYEHGLCAAAAAFGITSLRPAIFATRAAKAAAALDGRYTVSEHDAVLAAQLVLAPRAVRIPPGEEQTESQGHDPEPSSDTVDNESDRDQTQRMDPENLQNILTEAAKAALPQHLLAQLSSGFAAKTKSSVSARAGRMRTGGTRGRPIGTQPGDPARGRRLNLLATLRTAAPWQTLRRQQTETGSRIQVRREDFRVTKLKQNTRTVTIFVVDASGSAALSRLAEAKGAVELLLAECYVRRDQVALITFSGRGVDLALPPTRSLVRAKRRLSVLPGGGGTPLASAIEAATGLSLSIQKQGMDPVVVLLTDGSANIDRSGKPGRTGAGEDAMASARAFRAQLLPAILVDISPRPRPAARTLTEAMGARYLPLPHAHAGALSRAVLGSE